MEGQIETGIGANREPASFPAPRTPSEALRRAREELRGLRDWARKREVVLEPRSPAREQAYGEVRGLGWALEALERAVAELQAGLDGGDQ